ncbi:metal ABC transporter solute-binding protein, Zn/Mn family [Amphibacillus cookii]|uniref:metal ABC transporter solute-binding protein, Zn/Mn family n=1 Tax=Amphibacillus cookii TaxID=767787 RepID=UPI001957459B|nr:zinc ABC transporter substrate-binding protein [Amphibacillus cookii]MBM7542690.1 zinc transport system substrate-binding protein [Amphibacillus cookii]
MFKRKWLIAFLIMFVVSVVLIGCGQDDADTSGAGDEQEINVVASFYPMYEFTKQVAGDRANVTLMVSAGEDAHHYEPSAQDVAAVNDANVFVYSSGEMEFWAESLLNTIENDDLIVARAAEGIELTDTSSDGHDLQDESSIVINGVAHHYHTGDMIELTAELAEDVNYDDWHWYTREDLDSEWETVSGQGTNAFEYEATDESFEVQAVLFDDSHDIYAQSEPVEIVIDNHDHGDEHHGDHDDENHEDHDHNHHEDEAETIEITGLADHYHTGDVVTLEAQLDSEVNYDDWHWYKREASSDDEWEIISDQETNRLEYQTAGASFEVKAVLYDDDHHAYAESEPIQIVIDDHEDEDPHSWLDPVLAQEQVNAIRDALIEADPDGQEIYEENAETFNAELQTLHEEFETAFTDAENRVFVVQHQAFGYIAHRYNLEQVAIGGLSTEVEPSPSRIAEIGGLVEEYDVPVIYYQHGANSAIAQTVANETGTETAVLHDLEVLSEELMADDLGYIEAMRENLEALQLSIH